MQKAAIVWLLWVIAAAMLFVFTGTGAALLLLAATVALPPAQAALIHIAVGRVSAELSLPVTVQKGKKARGALLVRNSSVIPLGRVRLAITVLNALTGESHIFKFDFSLMPRREAVFPFEFESAHCGQLVFSCDQIKVFDFFGLYAARCHSCHKRSAVRRLVLPDTFPAHVRLSLSQTPMGENDARYLDRKGWDQSEVFQLRDYAEGDSQKQIHQKLTAKYGRLIVSDPSQPLDRALLVFWDRTAMPENTPPPVSDALAEVLVSICLAFTEDGIAYSVAWADPDAGRMVIKKISEINHLYDAIPGILSAPAAEAGSSGIDDCLRLLGEGSYPLIAYFSAGGLPESAVLAQSRRVTAFICVRHPDAVTGTGVSLIAFSPDNYKSVLKDVVI
jgi:uncharacterized protein (DUF58 family)